MMANSVSRDRVSHPQVHELRVEMERNGLTMAELALEAGVSLSMVKRVFSGLSSPTLRIYEKLAKAMDMTLVPMRKK